MSMSSLHDLFHETLRDILYAEKKLLKALPKMAKNSASEQVAEGFRKHAGETEAHVERLERIFEMFDKPARGKRCDAIEGLVAEAETVIEESDKNAVRDAGLISAAQAVEHYEISRYGTLIAWAKQMGHKESVALLERTLEEEKATDEALNALSGSINAEADTDNKVEKKAA